MPSKGVQLEINLALEAFRWNEAEYRALIHGPIAADLVKRAIRVESAAKAIASQPPPSVPGGGPAVRTGRLKGSITWRLGEDAESIYADIGSAVLYAPFVEYGTSRMAARPFLRPALEAARTT